MNWCEHCKSKETGEFCVTCGHPTRKIESNRKKPWLWIIIASVFVVLFGGSYFVMKTIASPERTVERFQNALVQEDEETLAEIVSPINTALGEQELKSFAQLMKDYPEERVLLIKNLRRQAQTLSSNKLMKGPDSSIYATIAPAGKRFYFFNKYEISIKPVKVELTTQYPKTSLLINNKKVGTFGDDGTWKKKAFMPGSYDFEAVLVNDGFTMRNNKEEIELFNNEELVSVDLPVNGSYISTDSNHGDATLFINGKDSGMKVSEAKKIGPYPMDGSLILHAEKTFDAGVVKSNSVKVEDSSVTLTIDYQEPEPVVSEKTVVSDYTESQAIVDAVNTYLSNWIDAYEHLDARYFTNVTPKLYNYFEDRFISARSSNSAFTGRIVNADFDMDSLRIDSSRNTAGVDVVITMDSANHEQGARNVQTKVTSSAFHYELVRSNGKWLIHSRKEIN